MPWNGFTGLTSQSLLRVILAPASSRDQRGISLWARFSPISAFRSLWASEVGRVKVPATYQMETKALYLNHEPATPFSLTWGSAMTFSWLNLGRSSSLISSTWVNLCLASLWNYKSSCNSVTNNNVQSTLLVVLVLLPPLHQDLLWLLYLQSCVLKS